ncbi:MAG: glycosyltransferase family 39 protein [Steroidobacteraceae bacterium]
MRSSSAGIARDLALVLLPGLLLIGAGIGLRDPWPADEPVYALIAREMLATGQWLIPMVGGDFFQDKPPLLFWLQAACYWLTGSERVGFLLPSLLAGLGTLALVYDLGRRLWSREAGLHAAWLLLFTVQFTLQSRRGQLDALLMFFTVLSLYCLLRQLLLGGGWRWAVAAGLAAGLGVLSKVVGFFSFLVLAPWLYAVWRGWPGVQWQRPWPMWMAAGLACAAVVGAWLLPIWLQARHDPAIAAYLEELVVTQTVGRYVTPWHHFRPPWYYLQVMLTLWVPVFLLLPWLVPRWRDALRARETRVLLPLGFVVLYLAFFALSSGKRDVYILSALPALTLPAGYLLPQLLQRAGVQRVFAALVLLIAGAAAALTLWATALNPTRAEALLAAGDIASVAPLATLAALSTAALVWAGWARAHLAFAATTAVAWLIAGFWVFPQMDGQRSAGKFIARVEALASPQRELGLLAYHEHFLWHLSRSTVNFGHRRFREGDAEMYDAAAWLAAQPGRQLLVPQRMLQACFATASSVREVGESSTGLWYLVQGMPEAGCAARGDAARSLRYTPPATD